ncbi:hypothetical protein KSP40_PGU020179 [Platanthera guangdongensis]|uniref:Uncharacterized protein n=1 Tax=Platanthera guangdongensis TaxID=2320717 RepID=A0ABR2MMR8_9ASPA
MPTPSPTGLGFSTASIPLLSAIVGGVLALLIFADYFRRKRAEVATIAQPTELKIADNKSLTKPTQSVSRKQHARSQHSHAVDKDQNKRHHPLDVNTLRGHVDSVTALCFSSDGRNLATSCADGAVRIFTVDDVSSKSFKLLKINLPTSAQPTAIAFSEGASSLIVAAQVLSGSSLYMYGDVILKPSGDSKQHTKVPAPEIKWEHHKIHEMRSVLTLVGVPATYGTGDGSMIFASCSEGTDIKLWHGQSGKELASVDTNQLKNNMATISPNGRFLAAGAFTADVKLQLTQGAFENPFLLLSVLNGTSVRCLTCIVLNWPVQTDSTQLGTGLLAETSNPGSIASPSRSNQVADHTPQSFSQGATGCSTRDP